MMNYLTIALIVAACTLTEQIGLNNRLPFYAEAIEPIYEVIENEPNKLDVLFECYEQETGLPYVYVIADNWLEYNPLYRVPLERTNTRLYRPAWS